MNDLQELVNVAGMTADAIESGKLVFVVRCKDCVYAERHCSDSVFGKPLYDCGHIRQIGREGVECHVEDWYCADGVKKDG
jgi:hypothetical protein